MKTFLFAFLFSIVTIGRVCAADYVVVRVQGNVRAANIAIKAGDSISTLSPILFSGGSPSLVLVNTSGTFILTPPASAIGAVSFAACTLQPIALSASTTHESDIPVSDIAKYFGDSVFVFVGDKWPVKLTEVHAPGEQHFLLYRYKYKGQIVSSQITHDKAGSIILEKKHLYTLMDGKTRVSPDSVSKVDILNYEVGSRSFSILASFRALWLDQELKSELSVLNTFYKKQGIAEEQRIKALIAYVQGVYGKTDEFVLKNWIRNNGL